MLSLNKNVLVVEKLVKNFCKTSLPDLSFQNEGFVNNPSFDVDCLIHCDQLVVLELVPLLRKQLQILHHSKHIKNDTKIRQAHKKSLLIKIYCKV